MLVDGPEGSSTSTVAYFVVGDAERGPTVSIMAGVHGCEYTSMLALRRFLADVDEGAVRGCLKIIPLANPTAFFARSAFVVPEDGLNLNRCFPGRADGSYAQRLAFALFDGVIRSANFHIDMHAGDVVEDLEPFTIFDASDVEDASRAMAHAYGLGHAVVVERSQSPIDGTSSSAAAQLGIPAITAEVGGRGLVIESEVVKHEQGLRRVLDHLGVLTYGAPPVTPPQEHHGWDWVRCAAPGWWQPTVRVGDDVVAGQLLGTVAPLDGSSTEEIWAPSDGVPLFITSSPAVLSDGLLLGLASR